MNNMPSHPDLRELILAQLDGTIADEQYKKLQHILNENSDARRYYTEYIMLCAALKRHIKSSPVAEQQKQTLDLCDSQLWQDLSAQEKTAPAIDIVQPHPRPVELIQKVQHQKIERKISKSALSSLFTAAAAIILFFMFARFAPKTGFEVATLTDSMNATWANTDTSMSKGTRFETNSDKYFLREGLAQLTFDNEAKVTLEGPVEFQILTEDQIKLSYGRLYAAVPQGAIGFTVNTSSARIIDLGTEFGIEATASGNTYLHVIKGKTTLIAGEKSNKVSIEIGKGIAKKVSALTSIISDIPCNENLFVRAFDSYNNIVWRQQPALDLADIVGGGNGFGTGRLNFGINPVTGQLGSMETENRSANNDYKIVPQNPFVDGVFVPNGKNKQIVSSTGHIFEQCPVTQGIYFTEIINTPDTLDKRMMILNNIRYSSNENTCIFMHANLGITFDLDAIRSRLPGPRIVGFQSQIGVSETVWRECNADFWVLVDGKLRYKKEHVQQKGLLDTLRIELSSTDRFLTIVTTDGGDPEARELPDGFIRQSIDCDWGVFGSPVLILE